MHAIGQFSRAQSRAPRSVHRWARTEARALSQNGWSRRAQGQPHFGLPPQRAGKSPAIPHPIKCLRHSLQVFRAGVRASANGQWYGFLAPALIYNAMRLRLSSAPLLTRRAIGARIDFWMFVHIMIRSRPFKIEPGSHVTLHDRLSFSRGADILHTFGRHPATLLSGAGQLAPFLEDILPGMKAGDHSTV